jgi:hypothetical protein
MTKPLESTIVAACRHCVKAAVATAFAIAAPNALPHDEPFLVAKATAKGHRSTARPQSVGTREVRRSEAPVVTVGTTGPGQSGYIHYFVITGPDGEAETQVGVELPGDLIAWSFPELGVMVSPFMQRGWVTTPKGNGYEVEHLYGIRPFPDDKSMRVLQQELASRVNPWLEDQTPFCDEQSISTRLCVSCLGFALRVLYPGASALLPGLPADFKAARKNLYTTEDLLLYLAGVPVDGSSQVRRKRIAELSVPESMREELVRLSGEVDAIRAAAAKPSPRSPHERPATVDLPKRVLSRRRS